MTKSQNAVKYVSAINYKSDRRTSIAETLKNVAIITLNLSLFHAGRTRTLQKSCALAHSE